MAKVNLASMSVETLLQLRNDVASLLSRKASELKRDLAALGTNYVEVDRIAAYGRKNKGAALKGRKVAAKYRGPGGETWAGRGAMPRWMAAAIKDGKKREDFLIDRSAAKAKRGRRKKK
jgi:DNA-binding protein H-NS